MTETTSPGAQPLIFPVGHYMGAFHDAVDGPVKFRRVRLGVEIEQLADDDHFGVWALAHGMPDRVNQGPWTRGSLIAIASEMGMSKVDQLIDDLISQGLLFEVARGTGPAVEFARRHRVQPLMVGLGNTPDDRLHFNLGFVGTPPALKINSFQYEVWLWSRVAPSLWELAEMFVKVEQANSADVVIEPPHVIDRVLGELHPMLAHNAAYLDRVLDPPQVRE